MRRTLTAALLLASLVLLLIGIYLFRQHNEWLNTRGLDRLSLFLLGSFGLAVVLTPIILRSVPGATTSRSFVVLYLRVFGQVFVILGGISIAFIAAGFVIYLIGAYPLFVLPVLLLLFPLGLIVIDMVQGNASKTLGNLLFGYGYYSYDVLYLLLAQLILLPILFFIGPLGFFFIFISAIDLASRVIPALEASPVPILCTWSGISYPYCTPSLLVLLLLYLLLIFIAARFGNRIVEGFSAGYHWGKGRLGSGIKRDEQR